MCSVKMAAFRAAVAVLLGLRLGFAAAAVPLVIWHGMGEQGPVTGSGADPPVTALWAGLRGLAGPARGRGRAGTPAGPSGAHRPPPAPLRCRPPPDSRFLRRLGGADSAPPGLCVR